MEIMIFVIVWYEAIGVVQDQTGGFSNHVAQSTCQPPRQASPATPPQEGNNYPYGWSKMFFMPSCQ